MRIAVLGPFAAVVLLGGCETPVTTPPPAGEEIEWQAALLGVAGWEHLIGLSNVSWTEGTQQFTASAELDGDEPGAVRPWHVHHNTCAAGGGIVGADGDYPRLEVDGDGSASATATVPLGLSRSAAYHVNVHLSEAEMETVIACGDLLMTLSN